MWRLRRKIKISWCLILQAADLFVWCLTVSLSFFPTKLTLVKKDDLIHFSNTVSKFWFRNGWALCSLCSPLIFINTYFQMYVKMKRFAFEYIIILQQNASRNKEQRMIKFVQCHPLLSFLFPCSYSRIDRHMRIFKTVLKVSFVFHLPVCRKHRYILLSLETPWTFKQNYLHLWHKTIFSFLIYMEIVTCLDSKRKWQLFSWTCTKSFLSPLYIT